ncbi:MAG: L-threonylcarbamoyladenylate synthase [Candidatus Latescibacterota bacterium]
MLPATRPELEEQGRLDDQAPWYCRQDAEKNAWTASAAEGQRMVDAVVDAWVARIDRERRTRSLSGLPSWRRAAAPGCSRALWPTEGCPDSLYGRQTDQTRSLPETLSMAEMLTIDPQHLKGRHITRAVEVLQNGGVIIYPTDTIYGLGCDITNKEAIERVRRIKGRSHKKPMSFVCSDLTRVSHYAHVTNYAYRILKRCLPGPYTFVLPATRETPRILQTRQKTVGLRLPDHPVPVALVTELGNPILSTSANRSDEEVLTDPVELQETMGNEVDLILECGTLPVMPSSVISLVGDRIEILREGQGDLDYFRREAAV